MSGLSIGWFLVLTRVSGDRIHIELTIEGADEPIASLYRNDQLVSV